MELEEYTDVLKKKKNLVFIRHIWNLGDHTSRFERTVYRTFVPSSPGESSGRIIFPFLEDRQRNNGNLHIYNCMDRKKCSSGI